MSGEVWRERSRRGEMIYVGLFMGVYLISYGFNLS